MRIRLTPGYGKITAASLALTVQCGEGKGIPLDLRKAANAGFADDVAFARHLVTEVGVAVVPGSSFYSRPELGRTQVRFCFCKRDETLTAAAERLATRMHGQGSKAWS